MAESNKPKLGAAGMFGNHQMACQYIHRVTSRGFWFGDNPLDFTSPVLMAQLVIFFFVTRTAYVLLRPLRQSMVISQIIAGILMTSYFLARTKVFKDIFLTPSGRLILKTFVDFGCMLHLFVLGVQNDPTLLKNTKKKATVIGTLGNILSIAFSVIVYNTFRNIVPLDSKASIVPSIIAINSTTYFAVTTSLLAELKILNSEIGRLASSSSLVSELCGWILGFVFHNVIVAFTTSILKPIIALVSMTTYSGIVFFILRPLVLWIVARTPEGQAMKETHFFAILVLVLGVGFFGECLGLSAGYGAFFFGFCLPDGPQLGSVFVHKVNTIASGILLPAYCARSGLRTDLYTLEGDGRRLSIIVELVIAVGYIGKILGTILPSLFFEIPFSDALPLGLIMCCKGLIEITIFTTWADSKVVNQQLYTISLISMVITTGIATPIVSYLYDPSRRYMAYGRRTILQSDHGLNLRILVCIHSENNVPPIINLIETSNFTRSTPIFISVLHLTELTGSAAAILTPYYQRNISSSKTTQSDHIFNAFKYFEQNSRGNVMVQHFIAVSPYTSMHDDICTLALENKISVIILPFHKQWAIDGTVEASSSSIRAVNKNVISKAPCSVGVLVDRGQIGCNQLAVSTCHPFYRVVVLFFGGADDREALSYSKSMVEHPNISLTVVWFKPWNTNDKINPSNESIMNDFRANSMGNNRINYKEEIVQDGEGTTEIIRSMEDDYDLYIVGKHHEPDSTVTSGLLTEWSECPELGIIGDILATSDFQFSILVVQQQPLVDGFPEYYPKTTVASISEKTPTLYDASSEFD